jgi:hypothetical protein
MKTRTKYFIGLLDLISALLDLLTSLVDIPVALWNFIFAEWRFNSHGQYSHQNIFSRMSYWASMKRIKISLKIEDKEDKD